MQGSAFCCHEHFVVVSDINNGAMTTPAANNGHDDVTELAVTSQWFEMLGYHKYALIWCDGTDMLSMSNTLHILYMWCNYDKEIVHMAADDN